MGDCNYDESCTIDKTRHEEAFPLRKYLPAAVSFVLLFAGIILNRTGAQWFANRWVNLCWFAAAYAPVGIPVLKEAWEHLRRKEIFNEFMLMGIATLGAFYIGQYPEGVAVMLFYAVGELFQDSALDKAKRNISELLDIRPETVDMVGEGESEGIIETTTPEQVRIGRTIEIKAGGRVPLDGIMENEAASFDTAALTGESVPRTIYRGQEVLAGMIAIDRVIRIKVTRPFSDSALARILRLVEEATERKAPAELFIRRFARIYTPIVVGLAVLVVLLPFLYSLAVPLDYVFHDWLYRGLVFLVISCPCALVISIPLGYFGGIGLASKNGILFKGSNYMDAIIKVNTVVMDKTGTLTGGEFKVRKVVAQGIGEDELLKTIASAEARSTHPIARAVVEYASSKQLPFAPASDITELSGYGVRVMSGGREILAGNAKLLAKYNIGYPRELEEISETVVICAIDGKYSGYIVVADALKDDAKEAVSRLRALGIENIVMLSGDRQAIASKVAAEAGIDHAYGDLLPEGKVRHVEELKKDPENYVAFVGDGINDAPVLALSDVGIAMGGLGSDAAIETADVIIQTDHPGKIATAITIGRMTRRIIVQNVSLAFGVKLIVLIMGAGGVATLWEAVFADVGVALLAILNASRLLYKKIK